MGHSEYSVSSRSMRATQDAYFTAPVDEIFKQNKARKIHQDMNPSGVIFRECRDSATHPNAIPVQLYLDVTGSMGSIPHLMIKDGLPTLMSSFLQNGIPDVALMFGAIGDHECDLAPLQIGQFESGDAELDMWLTRTWLEGNGGGNAGESYLLAWYFAGNHIKTDAFEKRKQKGFVFTIGDEPCLPSIPLSALSSIMGTSAVGQGTYTREQLLSSAKALNHVYHIHLDHRSGREDVHPAWKEMLGQNLIIVKDYTTIPRVISHIILSNLPSSAAPGKDESKPNMIL